jgi:hypothetical protein
MLPCSGDRAVRISSETRKCHARHELAFVESRRFPPELLDRARTAIERNGFCIFNAEELARLLAHVGGNHGAKEAALREFAEMCGAEVEWTHHFTSARLVRAEGGAGEPQVRP